MTALPHRLAGARLHGRTVAVADGESPGDSAAAYRLQDAVARCLGPMSDAWKVGSTSAEAQARLGTDEPGAARVPARYRHHAGDTVPVHAAHDLWIEAEFAFRLARDLPPRGRDYARGEVADAVAGVAPALEVVGSRLAGGLAAAGRHRITADGGANVALATGPMIGDWRAFDLPGHAVALLRNGVEIAAGTGARALGDPLNVLVWLANRQRRRDGLRAGETISTGTCTGLLRVAPGDVLKADFGRLGAVGIRLADAGPSV